MKLRNYVFAVVWMDIMVSRDIALLYARLKTCYVPYEVLYLLQLHQDCRGEPITESEPSAPCVINQPSAIDSSTE